LERFAVFAFGANFAYCRINNISRISAGSWFKSTPATIFSTTYPPSFSPVKSNLSPKNRGFGPKSEIFFRRCPPASAAADFPAAAAAVPASPQTSGSLRWPRAYRPSSCVGRCALCDPFSPPRARARDPSRFRCHAGKRGSRSAESSAFRARDRVCVCAEGSIAAALNGTKSFELLKFKARSIPIQKAIAVHA
jgi:hypothetical protein